MAYAYCERCKKEKHYRATRGSKLSSLTCPDCGGQLMGGKILPCSNPNCAEVRFKRDKELHEETYGKPYNLTMEAPIYKTYRPKVKVYPGETPLCFACQIFLSSNK